MSDKQPSDRIYASPLDEISGFRFDQSVTRVFPDMIKRSVPGYQTIIHMTGQIARRYAQAGSNIYDLGCSLGASTLSMRHQVCAADTQIIAVDNSEPMVAQCQSLMDADASPMPVNLHCQDILDVELRNASVVVLNFTLQFIEPTRRLVLLQRVAESLRPGGVLVLSEKIHFDDAEHAHLMTELHHDFKRNNGYSDLEIAQKRSALENVLIPETIDQHRERLLNAGFRSLDLWFQCFNFASMLAFKE